MTFCRQYCRKNDVLHNNHTHFTIFRFKYMYKALFLFIFLITSVCSNAQSPRIAKFSIRPTSSNQMLVLWTMQAGSTCPLLKVEKSLDGLNYSHAYTYPSVCGSADREISYSWVDPNPKQFSVNYYRLNLDDIEFTVPLVIDLQSNLANRNVIAYPNPTANDLSIDLRNPLNQTFDVKIIDSEGKLIRQIESLKGTSFKTDISNLKSGIYTLQIRFEEKSTESILFMVNH